MGLHLLFLGKKIEGEKLLRQREKGHMDNLIQDYFAKKANVHALEAIFSSYDARRSSILAHQKKLQEIVKSFPFFREGIMALAKTYLDLHRMKEATELLDKYLKIDNSSLEVHYYQCLIALERMQFPRAWHHFYALEKCLENQESPELKQLHFLKKRLEKSSDPP
jgi:tetratricopeptide (TPR) repeat protein